MEYPLVMLIEAAYRVAFLVLVSAGLAVVFGMMRVINLAHGEFVMLGGYATIASSQAGVNIYVAMLLVAPVVVGAYGLVVEHIVVRRLYGRMIDTMLATWGISLATVGLVTLVFGSTAVSVPLPIGSFQLGQYRVAGYNLFIVAVTTALALGLWALARHTRAGLIARAAMQGPEVSSCLGYDTRLIYRWTFTFGATLSGLAGGVLAPLTGLLPSSGTAYIAQSFITVIVGGPAVITGTIAASTVFGTVNQVVSFASTPVLGEMAMLLLAMILLRLMPQGITARFFKNKS